MEYKKEYTESFFLSAGETNAEREMSLPLLVSKLIDIATAHANSLGIGNPDMKGEKDGWVLVRLTVDMNIYPKVNTNYSITTWVEGWNRHFSERAFCISDGDGNPLGYARSVWMILNADTRGNVGLDTLNFKPEMISDRECPIERQGKHAKLEGEPIARYTFKYCDLDSYRHVNTVRYVNLLLNQFPLEIHDADFVKRLELSFLHEAGYGEFVNIRSQKNEVTDGEGSQTSFYIDTKERPVLYGKIQMMPRK